MERHATATDDGLALCECTVFLFPKVILTIFNFFLPLLDNILRFQKFRRFEIESKRNAMPFNTNELNRLIKERRSVFPKDYTGEKVDDTIVKQMLENATWAPTHKLTEPWRFMVFSGVGLKKLADFQGACYKRVTEANGTFKEERYQNLLIKPLESSHIISIGMKRDEKMNVPEWEELAAVFCAVQNMYLTATAYGVGCYISTGGITNFAEAKEFFGLTAEDKLCGFFQIGIPKHGVSISSKRKPLEEKTIWVG